MEGEVGLYLHLDRLRPSLVDPAERDPQRVVELCRVQRQPYSTTTEMAGGEALR